MKPVRQQKIRALLRQYPQGLTAYEMADITGMHVANVRTSVRAMPDVYVDRWKPGKRGQFEKVWMAVYVPPDCPHPKDKVFKGGMGFHRRPSGNLFGVQHDRQKSQRSEQDRQNNYLARGGRGGGKAGRKP